MTTALLRGYALCRVRLLRLPPPRASVSCPRHEPPPLPSPFPPPPLSLPLFQDRQGSARERNTQLTGKKTDAQERGPVLPTIPYLALPCHHTTASPHVTLPLPHVTSPYLIPTLYMKLTPPQEQLISTANRFQNPAAATNY